MIHTSVFATRNLVWSAYCNTKFELYGSYLAGTPYPLLGHNRDYAYGLTMFENDDIDLYQEENNPKDAKAYKTPNGFSIRNT
jgi:penicillin amidase